MPDVAKTFMIEDAELIQTHLNFSGRPGRFNEEGERSFSVMIDPNIAKKMSSDGWNIKHLRPLDEGGPERPFINIAVRFNKYPPTIVLLTSTARTRLYEDTIGILDWSDIKMVDLIARGHLWDEENNRIKAYLKSMFVTIEEDPLERKYDIIGNPPVNHG